MAEHRDASRASIVVSREGTIVRGERGARGGNLDGGGGTHPGALGHVRRDKQRQRFSGRDGERVVAAEGKERTDDVRGPRGSRVAGEARARGGVVLDVGWGEVFGRGGG